MNRHVGAGIAAMYEVYHERYFAPSKEFWAQDEARASRLYSFMGQHRARAHGNVVRELKLGQVGVRAHFEAVEALRAESLVKRTKESSLDRCLVVNQRTDGLAAEHPRGGGQRRLREMESGSQDDAADYEPDDKRAAAMTALERKTAKSRRVIRERLHTVFDHIKDLGADVSQASKLVKEGRLSADVPEIVLKAFIGQHEPDVRIIDAIAMLRREAFGAVKQRSMRKQRKLPYIRQSVAGSAQDEEDFIVMGDLAAALFLKGYERSMLDVEECWFMLLEETGGLPRDSTYDERIEARKSKLHFEQFVAWLEKRHPKLRSLGLVFLDGLLVLETDEAFEEEFKFEHELLECLDKRKREREDARRGLFQGSVGSAISSMFRTPCLRLGPCSCSRIECDPKDCDVCRRPPVACRRRTM